MKNKSRKEKRKRRVSAFWILIGIGCLILIMFIIVSNVIEVGERLSNLYVKIGFYSLAALLFFFLILNPLRIILFAPTFSIVTVLDEENKKSYRVYAKVAKSILENNELEEDDKLKLESGLRNKEELFETINRVFDSSIKKQINKIVLKNAKTVFISTAISQNGKLDMMTVLAINFKMIKEIVVKAGFRPTYAKLGKLSVKVLTTALITENIEGLDFTELFPASTANAIAEIPLIKPIGNSIINGLSNALLTLRIGIVTRRYLFRDVKKVTKEEIRRSSIKESVKMLPILMKEIVTFFPEKIAKLFKKKDNDTDLDIELEE